MSPDGTELPHPVAMRVDRLLDGLDAALPGRVRQAHLYGSVALGAFREGRSDIDVIVVLGGGLADLELAAIRRLHRRSYRFEAARGLARGRAPLVCNASYITEVDLRLAPREIVPLASHTGFQFHEGTAFDVNPVVWRTLVRGGITVRGPAITSAGLVEDEAELRRWNRQNLLDYWRPWATAVRGWGLTGVMGRTAAWSLVWGTLGAPRLHRTIATGEIVSKPEAGRYGLDVFDARWHPLVHAALAHWESGRSTFAPAGRARLEAADFVEMVVDDALALPA
jgi:predicted nucleotidyltransferase